jgi:uncharacterized damage-inducible protein DinB
MDTVTLLVAQIDQAYNRRSWHGTNLRGSLRGIDAGQASWRPAPARHNIQETVVHAAYWKYAVYRRLAGATRGSFPLKGSNWFPRRAVDATLWQADVRLLDDMHRQLRETVSRLDPARLEQKAAGGSTTVFALVSGIIAHDLYHAGQIQLLKRLRERGRSSRG